MISIILAPFLFKEEYKLLEKILKLFSIAVGPSPFTESIAEVGVSKQKSLTEHILFHGCEELRFVFACYTPIRIKRNVNSSFPRALLRHERI